MSLDSIFFGRRKILAYISLPFILVGFIGGIIYGHNWWTKAKPWLKYGESTCAFHYYFPNIIWIVSIIGIIILAIIIAFIFIKPISENQCLSVFLLVLLFLASIFNWVFGVVVGTMGFSYDYYDDMYRDNHSYKCYYDVMPSLFLNILDKANELNKTDEYYNWTGDFLDKIINNTGRSFLSRSFLFFVQYPEWREQGMNMTFLASFWFGMDYTGDYERRSIFDAVVVRYHPTFTNYLCSKVATPMIIFAVISFVGDILLLIAAWQCGCKDQVGNG